MLQKHLLRSLLPLPLLRTPHPRFAFATKDNIDYYAILEVQAGATEAAIRKAYAELTNGLSPDKDSTIFRSLNEAFVILTDNKSRDAYDSLMSVRKSYYLSEEQTYDITTKSYLAKRKANKNEELLKKINIDHFGRYKGGLPHKRGFIRGKSLNETGTMHTQDQIERALDQQPDFPSISAEKAESFKSYHGDEKVSRTMKWPWFSFEVDYQFFSLGGFRKKYWFWIQMAVLIAYVIPTIWYSLERFRKDHLTKEIRRKAQAKREASQKKAIEEALTATSTQPQSQAVVQASSAVVQTFPQFVQVSPGFFNVVFSPQSPAVVSTVSETPAVVQTVSATSTQTPPAVAQASS